MSGKMRITRKDVEYERGSLANVTGMNLYLEEYSDKRKNFFTLYQTDENGAVIKTLIDDYYTAFCNHPSNDGKSGQSIALSFICLTTKPLTTQNTRCEFFDKKKMDEEEK